jgi:hypothetical protein
MAGRPKKEVQGESPVLSKTVKIWFPCDTYLQGANGSSLEPFPPGEQEISEEMFKLYIEGKTTYELR